MSDTIVSEPETKGRIIDVNGFDVFYQEWGQGAPVVLIHGGGAGAYGYSNYRRNIEILSRTNRVIVPDLPGFGQSAAQPAPDGLFKMLAKTLAGLLDAIGIAKVSLVGNSLGGGTSIRFTLDYPERVEKLILMGPAGGIPSTSATPSAGAQQLYRFYDAPGGPTREGLRTLIENLIFDTTQITPELFEERFQMATRPETVANPPLRGFRPADLEIWREPLNKITHPTLLIWGRDDRVVPLDAAFILLRQIPNADLHVFSKCGHWAQWEQADKFNALVDEFLQRS